MRRPDKVISMSVYSDEFQTIITSRKNKMQSNTLYKTTVNRVYLNIGNVCFNSKWEEVQLGFK